MSEIIFLIEDSPDGGYTAKALGHSIYTDGVTIDELKDNIKDAVNCHFEDGQIPTLVRMHFVRDEVFAV